MNAKVMNKYYFKGCCYTLILLCGFSLLFFFISDKKNIFIISAPSSHTAENALPSTNLLKTTEIGSQVNINTEASSFDLNTSNPLAIPSLPLEKSYISDTDEQYQLFRKKMLENPVIFFESIAQDIDNPYFSAVLYEIPEEMLPLMIPYLSRHPIFPNVAFERSMHLEYPEEFENALLSWDKGVPPNGLVIPAIINGDLSQIDVIRDAALSSYNKVEIFGALSVSDFSKMTLPLADENWLNVINNPSDALLYQDLYVAARYAGNKEALVELSNIYNEYDYIKQAALRSQIRKMISYDIEFSAFENNAENLAYNIDLMIWY